ncbi:MAG: M48 family metalloprotease [Arenicella sp.]
MYKKIVLLAAIASFSMQAQAFDLGNAIKNSGGDLIKAGTLSEKDVINESRSAVKYMDSSNKVSSKNAKQSKRLDKLVSRIKLPEIEGVKFNFKVYETEAGNLNAFATPDGSIRMHSALMDAMTDDQVIAVIGHEIGHVVEKHSFKQMRKALLSSAAIRAAAGESSVGTAAYNAGMGDLAHKFVDASFSKSDEISADKYSLGVLKSAGAKPDAMMGAIAVLQKAYGDGGGMLSSHPSNKKRLKKLQKAIDKS